MPNMNTLGQTMKEEYALRVKAANRRTTVNSEIFARILFSRIALKDIFATYKIRDHDMIYLHQ